MEKVTKSVQITLAVLLLLLAGIGLFQLVGEVLADGFWEPTERIPTYSTVERESPDVAVDGLGRAYAVWQGYGWTAWTVFLSTRPAYGSWGEGKDLFIDEPSYDDKAEPVIAVDPTGNLHLVWSGDGIEYCYRPSGGACGPVIKVNDTPGVSARDPAVAMDASGNVYAVWSDNRNGDFDIYFSVLPRGGAWSANSRINDDTGMSEQSSPAIAVDPAGNVYVIWSDARDDVSDVFFSFRPAEGTWGVNVKVNDDIGPALQSEPDIAVDASSNAYAVWADARDLDQYDVYVYFSFRPAGGPWSPNVRVDGGAGIADQYTPKIAVDHLNYAHAIWTDERSIPSAIYSSVRSPYGEWGVNIKVDDETDGWYHDLPAIAVDVRGNVYAVWHGSDYRLYSSRKIVDPWPYYVYLPLLQRMD